MILFLIAFLCAVFASACFLKEILQKQEKYPQLEKALRIVSCNQDLSYQMFRKENLCCN